MRTAMAAMKWLLCALPAQAFVLAALDAANSGNAHYLGWARHSYNDVLNGQPPR